MFAPVVLAAAALVFAATSKESAGTAWAEVDIGLSRRSWYSNGPLAGFFLCCARISDVSSASALGADG